MRLNDGTSSTALGCRSRGEMPLANVVGGVAGLAQLSGDGGQIRLEAKTVVPYAGLAGVTASEHYGARWTADGLVGDGVIEIGSDGGKCIQIGGVRGTVEAVGADEVPTELVGMIDDDIRATFGCRWLLPG